MTIKNKLRLIAAVLFCSAIVLIISIGFFGTGILGPDPVVYIVSLVCSISSGELYRLSKQVN